MSGIQSLIFYLACFGLSAFLIYLGNTSHRRTLDINLGKKKLQVNLFVVSGLAIPILIASLRYGVGSDYYSYLRLYNNTSNGYLAFNEANGAWWVEPTFFIFSWISRLLTNSPYLVFTIYATITVTFFYIALKHSKIKFIASAFFMILLMFFFVSLNTVRQSASIAILFYALHQLFDGKFWRYAGWVIAAAFMHFSAILFLPLWLMRMVFKSTKKQHRIAIILLIFGAISIVSLFAVDLFEIAVKLPMFAKYNYASWGMNKAFDIGMTHLAYIAIFFTSLYILRKKISSNVESATLVATYSVGCALMFASTTLRFAQRLAWPVLPLSCVLVPLCTETLIEKVQTIDRSRFKKLAVIGLHLTPIIIAITYFVISLYLQNQSGAFPYRFLWQQGDAA